MMNDSRRTNLDRYRRSLANVETLDPET